MEPIDNRVEQISERHSRKEWHNIARNSTTKTIAATRVAIQSVEGRLINGISDGKDVRT
jgi:hypothetical protein